MMLKGLFSISLAALLLAAITFAALEVWIDIHAGQRGHEVSRLDEPVRPRGLPHGAEASPNH